MKIIKPVIIAAILLITTHVFAIEIEPHRLELKLPPGETSNTMIRITNWQDYNVEVKVQADYYRHIMTQNSIPPDNGDGKLLSCQGWITFEPNVIELIPRSSANIKCSISVPENVREETVASIMFDETSMVNTYKKDPEGTGNITLEVIPRFTIPVYITAVGNEVVSAKILDVDVKPGPTIGTMKTIITLLNNGTIHIRPSGNLAYVDAKGDIIKTIPIGDCLPVFADYKEEIPVYYSKMLKPGTYTAVCTINIGDGKLLQHKEDFTIADDFTIIEGHETR